MTPPSKTSPDKCPVCNDQMEFVIRAAPNSGRTTAGFEILRRESLRYCRRCREYRSLRSVGSPQPSPRTPDAA